MKTFKADEEVITASLQRWHLRKGLRNRKDNSEHTSRTIKDVLVENGINIKNPRKLR